MKRLSFTEEQIVGVLREIGEGAKTADLARQHGVSEATPYNWKAKRLRALEDENGRLKRLLANAVPDSQTQPMIRGGMGPEGGSEGSAFKKSGNARRKA